MKKIKIYNIFLSIFIFQLLSCSSIQECEDTATNVISIELENMYNFKLNNKKNRAPVIYLKINGQYLSFFCDTGAPSSYIYKSGVKKIVKNFSEWENKSIQEFYEDIIISNPDDPGTWEEAKKLHRNMAKQGIGYTRIPICFIQENKEFLFPITYTNTTHEYDGVLGLNFYKNMDSVIFDYENNRIIFNDNQIDSNLIPLKILNDERGEGIYIDCLLNGELESCLIDTGSNVCIVRQDFQKARNKIYDLIISEKTKGNYINIIKSLEICNIKYSNIDFYYSISTGLKCWPAAREYYKKHTGLGFPAFENHIIQIDFKNQLFGIK